MEQKLCSICGLTKDINQFYERKRGPQIGTRLAFCASCNTDQIRLKQYRKLEKLGRLDGLIDELKYKLRLAYSVKRENARTERNRKALEIGLRILRDTERQEKQR